MTVHFSCIQNKMINIFWPSLRFLPDSIIFFLLMSHAPCVVHNSFWARNASFFLAFPALLVALELVLGYELVDEISIAQVSCCPIAVTCFFCHSLHSFLFSFMDLVFFNSLGQSFFKHGLSHRHTFAFSKTLVGAYQCFRGEHEVVTL